EDEAIRVLETARRQMQDAVETGKRPGRIYKKTGRPCPRCRAARIRSRGQGEDNRTTYWCPNCQA
ncbi:MAG TPA: zinc finger domain-containing protein, partial [Solirubrobacterales bacterium]|nr:zinc finger domain-containing protein [Solirubrobacterales bacterium]